MSGRHLLFPLLRLMRWYRNVLILCLLFLLLWCAQVGYAQTKADDVTLIGDVAALMHMDAPITAKLITSENQSVTLEVSQAVVTPESIWVRFFVWGLPVAWTARANDPARIYGSYLPVAELGLPSGEWLTPGTRSRYSLLSNGNSVVVAGLLYYATPTHPDIVSLNFNQIPFDFSPLSEGAVVQLPFVPVSDPTAAQQQTGTILQDIHDDIGFFLMNIAQTTSFTMLQPGYSCDRKNEMISGLGRVSVTRSDDKRYVLARGEPFGFNLADDRDVFLQNGYTFSAISSDAPLHVSLDGIYLTRETDGEIRAAFPSVLAVGSHGTLSIPVPLDEFHAEITGYSVYAVQQEAHEFFFLRLLLDVDPAVQSIPFTLYQEENETQTAHCGWVVGGEQFACDLPFNGLERDALTFYYHSFEYLLDKTWKLTWNPVPLAFAKPLLLDGVKSESDEFAEELPLSNDLSETRMLVSSLGKKMAGKAGWIVEKTKIQQFFPGGETPSFVSSAIRALEHPILFREEWHQIDSRGLDLMVLTVFRDVLGNLLSVRWSLPSAEVSLPQWLYLSGLPTEDGRIAPYQYGGEFLSMTNRNIFYMGSIRETITGTDVQKFTFVQALGGQHFSAKDTITVPANRYSYWIHPQTGEILRSQTDCNLDGLESPLVPCIIMDTISFDQRDKLDQDVQDWVEHTIF